MAGVCVVVVVVCVWFVVVCVGLLMECALAETQYQKQFHWVATQSAISPRLRNAVRT
jgi:hypothetical protein